MMTVFGRSRDCYDEEDLMLYLEDGEVVWE